MARRLAPRRLRVRPAGAGQGPGVPQVVPGGGADPRAVGDGGRAGHLRGAGVERDPVVRGRRRPGRHRALLLRLAAGHAAAAHGVGGVQALGGLLQPGLAVRRVGHALVPHRRKLRQLHRRARLPRRQVLRPARPRRHRQGRRLHPRRRQARAAQARRDQARPPRHARHAHLLLRGRTGQDAARRARPMILHCMLPVPTTTVSCHAVYLYSSIDRIRIDRVKFSIGRVAWVRDVWLHLHRIRRIAMQTMDQACLACMGLIGYLDWRSKKSVAAMYCLCS